MIVGLTGYAQHGKDSVGGRLEAEWGFTRFAFADGVRAAALAIDPMIGVDIAGNAWRPVRLGEYVRKVGWDRAKVELAEVGRLLQVIGTEGVRDVVGEDSWIRALERRWLASGAENVVVTDVRFDNEAEWIRRQGGVVVRVDRPGFVAPGRSREHPSEQGVESIRADMRIVNDGTLADLELEVDALAQRLNAKEGA